MNTTQTPPPPAADIGIQAPNPFPKPAATPAPSPVPALPAPHQALLADFDDPDLTELDLARRHALTLDDLAAIAATPAFARALALLRALREFRRPLQIARAEARAAETLTSLSARAPTSATAAKEVRLAVKDLLRLFGAGGILPPDRPKADAHPPPFPNGGGPGAKRRGRGKCRNNHQSDADHPQPDAPSAPGAGGILPPDRPQADAPFAFGAEAFPLLRSATGRCLRLPRASGGGAGAQRRRRGSWNRRQTRGRRTSQRARGGGSPPHRTHPKPPKPARPRGTKPRPKPRSR